MRPSIMTAFTTHCCTNAAPEPRPQPHPRPHPAHPDLRRWVGWAVYLCALLLSAAGLGIGPAHAQTPPEITSMEIERSDEGLLLTARLQFDMPAPVEEALLQGIPIYFSAEAELLRERWYWADRSLATTRRYTRLMYQPLTRRWRLNTSSEPLNNAGLGVSLTQNFDTLDEALTAVQRIGRWKIASADDIDGGGRHVLRFRFRLDVSQLPRTLQIGSVGHSDWAISVERRIDLTQELAQ